MGGREVRMPWLFELVAHVEVAQVGCSHSPHRAARGVVGQVRVDLLQEHPFAHLARAPAQMLQAELDHIQLWRLQGLGGAPLREVAAAGGARRPPSHVDRASVLRSGGYRRQRLRLGAVIACRCARRVQHEGVEWAPLGSVGARGPAEQGCGGGAAVLHFGVGAGACSHTPCWRSFWLPTARSVAVSHRGNQCRASFLHQQHQQQNSINRK